jgi:hypothetical protein
LTLFDHLPAVCGLGIIVAILWGNAVPGFESNIPDRVMAGRDADAESPAKKKRTFALAAKVPTVT